MNSISKIQQTNIDHAWLGLGDVSKIKIINPLDNMSLETLGLDLLRIWTNPDYLAYACKVLLNIELMPMQAAILQELWVRPFPMFVGSRGLGKSWMLAIVTMLKCALSQGTKAVIVGAAFRQSKIIFEYMENIWRDAPILREIFNKSRRDGPRHDVDRCTMTLGFSTAIAIPLGDGSKIRGLRAHLIVCDEFSSIASDIYETIIQGFAAVSADPLGNVKETAKRKEMSKKGLWTQDHEIKYKTGRGNQAIISGTADYGFKSFASYWKRYCAIIKSKGDPHKLAEILGDDDIPKSFDWRDYSVIRVPYELIPEGFMDEKIVARAKATMHTGIWKLEYGAVFTDDSDGFFKRSLIEQCVTDDKHPVQLLSGNIWFDATTKGNSNLKYVYGIDPASEQDNFSIVVLEIHPDHTRIVYGWSTNKSTFENRKKKKVTQEHDYYGFCVRKIRDLMKVFPCEIIGCDAQGGGIAIQEALHDPSKMEKEEHLIWATIDLDKPKDSDIESGLHIFEPIQFADAKWTAEANNGLRKDFEDRVLLFPRFDPLTLELAIADDAEQLKMLREKTGNKALDANMKLFDTLEDSVMEIEELKNELCTITITTTSTKVGAREHWDVPEIKKEGGKKGRMRKDRYSALVIANMLARQLMRTPQEVEYQVIGGDTRNIAGGNEGPMYYGPEWFTKGTNEAFSGMGVINTGRGRKVVDGSRGGVQQGGPGFLDKPTVN